MIRKRHNGECPFDLIGSGRADGLGDMVWLDGASPGSDDSALHSVFQLAHIARPVVGLQDFYPGGTDGRRGLV